MNDDCPVYMWGSVGHTAFIVITVLCVLMKATVRNTLAETGLCSHATLLINTEAYISYNFQILENTLLIKFSRTGNYKI